MIAYSYVCLATEGPVDESRLEDVVEEGVGGAEGGAGVLDLTDDEDESRLLPGDEVESRLLTVDWVESRLVDLAGDGVGGRDDGAGVDGTPVSISSPDAANGATISSSTASTGFLLVSWSLALSPVVHVGIG